MECYERDTWKVHHKILTSSTQNFCQQNWHCTEHAIAQLVDQIYETFEKNEYTLGVFIDLPKGFELIIQYY